MFEDNKAEIMRRIGDGEYLSDIAKDFGKTYRQLKYWLDTGSAGIPPKKPVDRVSPKTKDDEYRKYMKFYGTVPNVAHNPDLVKEFFFAGWEAYDRLLKGRQDAKSTSKDNN